MYNAKKMGEQIRRATLAKDLPVYRLARKTGVSLNTMYQMVNGQERRTLTNLVAICRVLELSADELLGLRPPIQNAAAGLKTIEEGAHGKC